MTKRLLAVAALVLLATAALAGVTGASSNGSKASSGSQGKLGIRNGVIYGCVETHGSKQTLGDLKLANCHKGFKAIAWNIRGPKGARGVGTPGARRDLRACRVLRVPQARQVRAGATRSGGYSRSRDAALDGRLRGDECERCDVPGRRHFRAVLERRRMGAPCGTAAPTARRWPTSRNSRTRSTTRQRTIRRSQFRNCGSS